MYLNYITQEIQKFAPEFPSGTDSCNWGIDTQKNNYSINTDKVLTEPSLIEATVLQSCNMALNITWWNYKEPLADSVASWENH